MRLKRRGFVEAAQWAVRYLVLYAFLADHRLTKQTPYVSRHRVEHSDVSKMAVAPSSKHFAGVRKVWVGTS